MLKLQQLKQKQQQQQTPAPTATEATTNPAEQKQEDSSGYVLKRQNSKELVEKRRQKSKEKNVFTLKSTGNKKDPKKKKVNY